MESLQEIQTEVVERREQRRDAAPKRMNLRKTVNAAMTMLKASAWQLCVALVDVKSGSTK